MTTKRGAWLAGRGQDAAAAAIAQVLDRPPQPDEAVQQLPDAQIADSPYQARQPFSADSLAELAQGMRAVGFQGVLVVRPHGEAELRRQGQVQLVYGHRRRAAWRLVCAERGVPCRLPVVVRAVSDAQLLVIGAQENLQRQDLDPIEEGQLVTWHERLFPEQSQAEIGALLGKSADWVSTRARVHFPPRRIHEYRDPGGISGHMWLVVTIDGVAKDVCPGDPNIRPGQVHVRALSRPTLYGPALRLLGHIGSMIVNVRRDNAALRRMRAVPAPLPRRDRLALRLEYAGNRWLRPLGTWLYRRTGGRLPPRDRVVLLLTTRGRWSGRAHTC